jgi:hypothetical protein
MKKILSTVLVLALCVSCATATRVGLAGAGAVGGSLLGPGGTFAGAAVGVASADILLHEETIEEQQEAIQALSRGDVESISKPFVDKALEQVYSFLKMVLISIGLFLLGSFLWTHKRKRYAQRYYQTIDRWLEEEKNE